MYLTNDSFVTWGLSLIIGLILIILVIKNIKTIVHIINPRKNEKGFTLIELLIVIALIGVLAAIAIPQFASYRIRGFDADAMSVLRTASLTQEAYFTDNDSYTSNVFVLLNDYNLETGEIMITQPMVVDQDSYHIEASHPSSPNWYEVNGPGGTIQLVD